ncbi:MAG: MarR family transcriptional regulator [bacterium]|nr:MarR family transcriptional regulator [bacterium]MCY3961521.1 MarR family transcriptional regulator [bacterium]
MTGAVALVDFEDLAAERYVAGLRWPDGLRCTHCRSGDVAVRSAVPPLRWRCRGCRSEFTVTSGTAMHGSRIGAGRWVAAAVRWEGWRSGLARTLGVSSATAGRVLAALEATGRPPGEERLRVLLGQDPDPAQAKRSRLPGYLAAEHDPTVDMTPAERRCLAVLRDRPRGVRAEDLAVVAQISKRHARRCLGRLAENRYARREVSSIPWGYQSLEVDLWFLNLTEECVTALAHLPQQSRSEDGKCPGRVPPEFWWVFWSGAEAGELKLPEHADYVASVILDGPDQAAREWALKTLPVSALSKCRQMRGYDTGRLAAWIDAAISGRGGLA